MAVADYIAEATTEINAAKPINKNTNGEVVELSDAEYDAKITALASQKNDEAQNGYKRARQMAYPSIEDQLDMQYWDNVNGTTTWKDHIAKVKDDNPKPSE